ncbi:MAG TPA: TusE/DsrC/DsvC family sulfur relay protein [Syntrophales bacterium]|nr:TusE/DsrC/DsvC family sulfur relay protein [Syntrophales bacterium]
MEEGLATGQDQVYASGHRERSIAGRKILFDASGFLLNADDWSEELAEILARENGMGPLDDSRWKVVHFLRDYYRRCGRPPSNHELKEGTGFSLMILESLFPGGVRGTARLLAGLPNPRTCL